MPELRTQQKIAVQNLSNGKILCGGVGSGKSLTSIAYYWENERPRDIYVITTAKKRDSLDWEKEAAHYGISKDVSLAGKLKVDSWNNIGKYTEVKDAFFIFDEQRLVGSGAWTKSFIKISKKNHWILLSATPGESWMDYIPVFVANGFYKNRTEFIREHVVYNTFSKFPKVDRYINTGRLDRQRRSLLVEMRYVKHTKRHTHIVPVSFDKDLFNTVWHDRWHIYEDRPLKDGAERTRVARRLVNSDPSRLDEIWRLRGQHKKNIIFYNFNYELDILRILSDDVLVAEWNGHKHQEVPDTDEWLYLVQYTAGAEGWQCQTTDTTTFYSLPNSFKQFTQAFGRIDRLDTPFIDLNYYLLRSNALTDQANWRAMKEKRNFHESELSESW